MFSPYVVAVRNLFLRINFQMFPVHRAIIRCFHPIRFSSIALIAVSVISCVFVGASARTWLTKPGSQAVAQATPPRMEVELIGLTPGRCSPNKISRPQGRFLLAVDNRAGLSEDITLGIDDAAGRRLYEFTMSDGQPRLRKPVEFQPGRYLLIVTGHPEWKSEFNITDQ